MENIAIICSYNKKWIDFHKILKNENVNAYLYTNLNVAEQYTNQLKKVIAYEKFPNKDELIFDILIENELHPFSRIIVLGEYELEIAAKIREELNIDGQNLASVEEFRNKVTMKNRLVSKVTIPNFSEVNDSIDLYHFIHENGYPIVIKPKDGAGSVGVNILNDYESTKKFLKSTSCNNLIAEELVVGDMYHCDGIFCDGKLLKVSISKYINGCLAFENGDFLASYTVLRKSRDFKTLEKLTADVLSNLMINVNSIVFHAEFFKNENGEFIFCEIASRVGGGLINDLFVHKYGFSLLEYDFRRQMEGIIENNIDTSIEKSNKIFSWIVFPPKQGKLVKLELPSFSFLEYVYFDRKRKIGKVYRGATYSADSIVSFLFTSNSADETFENVNKLSNWYIKNGVWEYEDANSIDE